MSFRTLTAGFVVMMCTGSAAAQTTPTTAFTFSRSDYASDGGGRGMVSGDFDLDGAPDFATVNAGTNTVDVFMNRRRFLLRRGAPLRSEGGWTCAALK
jgi:hypothetical protein